MMAIFLSMVEAGLHSTAKTGKLFSSHWKTWLHACAVHEQQTLPPRACVVPPNFPVVAVRPRTQLLQWMENPAGPFPIVHSVIFSICPAAANRKILHGVTQKETQCHPSSANTKHVAVWRPTKHCLQSASSKRHHTARMSWCLTKVGFFNSKSDWADTPATCSPDRCFQLSCCPNFFNELAWHCCSLQKKTWLHFTISLILGLDRNTTHQTFDFASLMFKCQQAIGCCISCHSRHEFFWKLRTDVCTLLHFVNVCTWKHRLIVSTCERRCHHRAFANTVLAMFHFS